MHCSDFLPGQRPLLQDSDKDGDLVLDRGIEKNAAELCRAYDSQSARDPATKAGPRRQELEEAGIPGHAEGGGRKGEVRAGSGLQVSPGEGNEVIWGWHCQVTNSAVSGLR